MQSYIHTYIALLCPLSGAWKQRYPITTHRIFCAPSTYFINAISHLKEPELFREMVKSSTGIRKV